MSNAICNEEVLAARKCVLTFASRVPERKISKCGDTFAASHSSVQNYFEILLFIIRYSLLLRRQVLHGQLLLNLPRAGMQQG